MNNKRQTFLAIGAHLDDAFLGAGGVLIQAAQAGHRVVIVTVVSDFSSRAATRGHEAVTKKELLVLSKKYGFEHRLLGRPYHQLNASDLALKKELAAIKVEIRPDVAFIHHAEDHWSDHRECAELSHDALLFSHGLTSNLTYRSAPLIYAYDLTPVQTYHFEPDVYFDVSVVMKPFMELILAVDACANRLTAQKLIAAEFRTTTKPKVNLRLSHHGMLRLADCLRFGDRSGCPFALGFRTVWGRRAERVG